MNKLYEDIESLSVHDIAFAKAFNMPEDEILRIGYYQDKRKLENKFSTMIWDWFHGNKPDLTLKDAKALDVKYKEIVYKWEKTFGDNFLAGGCDAAVRFAAIPENDYSIVLYMGYPFDTPICNWAEKMMKERNV